MALNFMLLFTSCRPNPDGDDDTLDTLEGPTKEGIYIGVIGFNENFTTKDIKLLDRNSFVEFRDFINKLEKDNGTGLYYADYLALNKLDAYGAPPKLSNVALVTFTDGLDNVSLNEETNPENHSSTDAYCNSLSNRIKNQQIHGKRVNAYTIGIKGTDVYAVIVAKRGTPMEMEGFMGEALVLEATAMGLGTCWCGLHPMVRAVKKVRAILGAPENHIPMALIHVGYPDEFPEARTQFEEKRVKIID